MDPADERLRVPDPILPGWTSTWWFAAVVDHGAAALWVEVTLDPTVRRTSFIAALARTEGPPVVIADHEMPWPKPERYLELRGRESWSHHVCEEPLRRWSVAAETTATALEDPADGLDTGWGMPDGLAYDLEWEVTAEPAAHAHGWTQPAEVHGPLETVGTLVELEGVPGARGRWWGVDAGPELIVVGGDPTAVVRDGHRWEATELPRHAVVDGPDSVWSVTPAAHVTWRHADGRPGALAVGTASSAAGATQPVLARWRA